MAKQIDQKTILTIGVVGLGVYILYKPIKAIFDTFGITQSETTQEVIKQQTSGQKSPFSPLFWRSIKKAHILTQAQATAKAKAIWESFDDFGEDYERVLAIFKTLSYKSQVSFLAEKFAQLYKADLLQFLKDGKSRWLPYSGFSEKQLQIIIDYVNKLK